jgi:hypothetical protein
MKVTFLDEVQASVRVELDGQELLADSTSGESRVPANNPRAHHASRLVKSNEQR